VALTPAEIVSLASELKGLGVRRFAWGDVSLEFAEPGWVNPADGEDSDPADIAPADPVTRAAHRLANRATRAA